MLSLLLLIEAAAVSGVRPHASFGAHMFDLLAAHPYLTTLAALVSLYFLIPLLIDLPHRLPHEPPLVPSYLPYLGSALAFSSNPHAFLSSCRATHGDVFTVHLAGRRMTFLCDPLSYAALFRHKGLVFADVAGRIAREVFDQGKASVEDEAVGKAVHSQYVQHLSGEGLETLTSATDVQLRAWMRRDRQRRGEGWHSVGLYRYMTDLAFEAGVKTMFGEDVDTATLQPLFYQFDAAFPLFVGGVPSFLLSTARAARSRLNAFLGSLSAQPHEAGLMKARRELFTAASTYRQYDIGATQTGMLWASVANTVPAAFWTIAYLLCEEGAMRRVKEEVDRVVPYHPLSKEGGEEGGVRWTRELCSQLKLTDSAVSEALRLTTGSMVLREATTATTLTLASGQTVALRPGDGISVYPALTHLDGRVFAEPLQYRVDRFVDAPVHELNGVKVPMAFMPFGGGVSLCPGRHWARNEIVMLVALLLQHVEWRVEGTAKVPSMDYSRVGIGVYQPKGELQLSLRYK